MSPSDGEVIILLLLLLANQPKYQQTIMSKKRIHGLFILYLVLCTGLKISAQTGDSLRYLTPQDTIYLTTNPLKQHLHTHQIAEGQTLYSLARFYGLSYTDLLYYNQNLVGSTISIGQSVKVPIPLQAIVDTNAPLVDLRYHSPVCYVVQAGDTYFGVAKRKFNMSVDSLKRINRSLTEVLEIGQVLQLGWLSHEGIPDSLHGKHTSPIQRKDMLLGERFNAKSTAKRAHYESGVAFWQKGRKAGGQLFALHRKAPVNSVLRISNPMTKAVVHAKVIGKLPDNAYSRDIVTVISPKVAQMLGAKDARFYVKIKYLK